MDTSGNLPRRAFLTRVCGIGGAVSLAASASPARTVPTSFDVASATCATFRPCVGDTFVLYPEGAGPVAVELVRADEQPHRKPYGRGVRYVPRRRAFSLVFRGDTALPQQNCRVEHDRLGRFALFIVPAGPGLDGRMRYAVSFN